VDVTVANFEEEVLKASFKTPVVVDFWAPWCGPCNVLTPVLDKLASEANGQWKLAKVNTDAEPQLAQALQIQSLPTVKLLFEGRQVSEFNGAQPEDVIAGWLAEAFTTLGITAAPSVEEGIAPYKELIEEGHFDVAARGLTGVLQADPENKEARLLLATVLFPSNRADALQMTEEWKEGDEGFSIVTGMHELEAILGAEPQEGTASELFKGGSARFVERDFAGAAEAWVELTRTDRTYMDDIGRRGCLALFAFLGNENPVTGEYRRALAATLF